MWNGQPVIMWTQQVTELRSHKQYKNDLHGCSQTAAKTHQHNESTRERFIKHNMEHKKKPEIRVLKVSLGISAIILT